MGLEKYFGKKFKVSEFCNLSITRKGSVYIYSFEASAAIYLESIRTEEQLLQLFTLLEGKDQNEFKAQ